MPVRRFGVALAILTFAMAGTIGCLFGPTPEEKFRQEIISLTKEQAFEKGKELISKKKWEKGRKYLTFVHENYPTDPISRDALLRLADSYSDEGTEASYVEGLYRYRDYQSRYPSRPESDYVLMRIGDCQLAQSDTPDRDQTETKKALAQFQDLLRLYPETLRRNEVTEKIKKCRRLLALHELHVGRFYIRRGFTDAGIGRLAGVLQDFPEFDASDEVIFWLVHGCVDLRKYEEARFFRKRLLSEYPKSVWVGKIPTVPEASGTEPIPAETSPSATVATPPAGSSVAPPPESSGP